MPRGPRFAALVVAIGVALVASPRGASADPTKSQCVEADTSAQTERRAEQFRAARAHLETCSRPACPALVREDCVQRLNDLDAIAPSVVFAAKDSAGDDLVAVRVTMDGAPLATELNGSAIAVDPGVHAFHFEADGKAPVDKKVVVREGERGREIPVVFSPVGAAVATAPVPVVATRPDASAKPTSSSWSNQKTAAIVVGGAGLVGIIVGSITGAMSFSSWSSSQSACGSSSCTDRATASSDHDSAVTDATISDVGFIAGGALLAGGVVLYLTAPKSSSSTSGSAALHLVPSLRGMSLAGTF